MKINHKHFETLNSTQSYLREALEKSPQINPLNLVSADRQTDGYGRQGKKWNSAHRGLFMSFILKPHEVITLTSLEIAVLVSTFFHKEFQINLDLKWPNDLIYKNGKCGGILLQTFEDQVIVGLGINLSDSQNVLDSENFEINPSSLPVSLISNKELSFQLYKEISSSRLSSNEIIHGFESRCIHLNRKCTIGQGNELYEGLFIGCGPSGEALTLSSAGEKKSFYSGTLRYN